MLENETQELTEGHLIWIPAGLRHSLAVAPNSVLFPCLFPLNRTATRLHSPAVLVAAAELRLLLLVLMQAQNSILRPEVNIERQVLALIEKNPVVPTSLPMPTSGAARSVAEDLCFNPGDDRLVEDLAASASVSVSTLEREFRAETGLTLRAWRLRNRMEAAAALFRETDSISAVASRVGYVSVNAFHRAFKSHHGVTPGDYIARFRSPRASAPEAATVTTGG